MNNITGRDIIASLQNDAETGDENYVPIETCRALTGQRARQSEASLFANLAKKGEGSIKPDTPIPATGRRERRMQARREASATRRGQRAYVRRELLAEQVTADLRHQFAIIDGTVPARPECVVRALQTLSDKAQTLVEQDAARFQKEVAIWFREHPDVHIRPAGAVRPVLTNDEALSQLRKLAG